MGALLVAFITCFVQPVAAQEYRGTIRGVVTDPTHAVVPNAKVTLQNINTTISKTVQTDSSGFYIFDLVQPGSYTVTVEAAGFQKFVQENITVQTTGDVTVNAVLTIGSLTQTVTVTEQVAQVQFNTSSLTTTISGSNLRELPVLSRNPFTLALLNAAVINDYWDVAHRMPFYMWSNGGMDIGGPTGGKNEQLLDGTTLNVSARGSYNAPMDAVQELVVQANVPDAEFGFSAGGTLNLSTKSGTNSIHGTAYFMGRQPGLDALANRVTRSPDVVHQQIYGGTLGQPIIKNKLFNFFAFEKWNATQPSSKYETLPTVAERGGDFSQALTPEGQLRVIYDPLTTVFNPVTDTVTRTPFPGNIIPANRIDPTAKALMSYLWMPNHVPLSPDGLDNFIITYPWYTHYWNIDDRADWNINDKWRMYARFSKFQTRLDNVNWGNSIAVPSDNGGIMDAMEPMMDWLYMAGPRTTLDIRMGVIYDEDDYNSRWAKVPTSVWASLWPNNNWYTNVLNAKQGIYFPSFTWYGIQDPIQGEGAYTGYNGWWQVHPRQYSPTINLTHEMGNHHLKFGWQLRYSYDQNGTPLGPGSWSFNSIDTGNTFLSSYVPAESGDQWASGLLGIVDSGSSTVYPTVEMHQQQWTFYGQDDLHLSQRITLNLGLRWERELAPAEVNNHLIRTWDSTEAIPELQGFTVWGPQQLAAIPSTATGFLSAVQSATPSMTGAIIYTNKSNPRMYDAPWDILLPRLGIAYRLNDKTAVRAGYARYAVPWLTIHPETGYLPEDGFSAVTPSLGPLDGAPRSYISNPYPTGGANPNPLILPTGNSLGRYEDLGNSVLYFWDGPQMKTPYNDRMNINVQRQMPSQFLLEATMFMMFAHNAQDQSMWGGPFTYNVNMMNPMLAYQYQGLTALEVPNPFYQAFPSNIMPGPLATQQYVPAGQLLAKYPQYLSDQLSGGLWQQGWPGYVTHYYGFAFQVTRPMSHGYTLLGAYNYSLQSHTGVGETYAGYYDNIAQYNNTLTTYDRGLPRHNIRIAGTYELPFGRGRQYFNNVPKAVDELIGGWSTSHIFWWVSGDLLFFPNSDAVVCNPTQNIPKGMWFNANCLVTAPPYTIPTIPPYYEGLRGPRYWDIDSTLSKFFNITERVQLEFRIEAYNLTNSFVPSDPNVCGVSQCGLGVAGIPTSVASASSGASYGREIQYSARFHW
jgi:hypothetical protein